MRLSILVVLLCLASGLCADPARLAVSPETIRAAFQNREGVFVLVDCATGEAFHSDAARSEEKSAPCSTFKIWNSAIGLELGIVKDADAPFWTWDHEKREIEDWNKDQTLRTAFAASCVPAYQKLARSIGEARMKEWLDKIAYGDRNTSAGIDTFWLPSPPERKVLLISPREQAELIVKLVNGKLPFSASTLATLKSIMTVKTTERGVFYGKTGTGTDAIGRIGWFVGYVESGGRTCAFACRVKGEGVMGKDARAAVERILTEGKML